MKWNVYISAGISTSMEVEADTFEEACDQALCQIGHANMSQTGWDNEADPVAISATNEDGDYLEVPVECR